MNNRIVNLNWYFEDAANEGKNLTRHMELMGDKLMLTYSCEVAYEGEESITRSMEICVDLNNLRVWVYDCQMHWEDESYTWGEVKTLDPYKIPAIETVKTLADRINMVKASF